VEAANDEDCLSPNAQLLESSSTSNFDCKTNSCYTCFSVVSRGAAAVCRDLVMPGATAWLYASYRSVV